jgi:SAM-dependent methyltransferase
VFPDLTDPAGRAALAAAIEVVRSVTETNPVRRAARIRALLDADIAAAAITQVELRDRARGKFGPESEELYFTPDGLEQSTRRELADHRAGRFAAAGARSVLDLCCGIGADALGFLRAGLAVSAVEQDPATAAIAAANVRGRAAEVLVGNAEDAPWQQAESVFLDPARRTARGRSFDPSAFSPSFTFVLQVMDAVRLVAAKLSPGLDHGLIPASVEAEWVSFSGGVKEAVLWSSGFAEPGLRRRATVLPAGVQLTDADPAESTVGPIGDYLFEPDGAVIRAGLVQQAASVLGGRRIDEHLAYLTADQPASSPLARGYSVVDVLPYSVKRLKAELRRREVGVVEIKKRGVDIDPARLRRELKPNGPNSITVVLARVGEDHLAILAHPCVG